MMLRRRFLRGVGGSLLLSAGFAKTAEAQPKEKSRERDTWSGPTVDADDFVRLNGTAEDDAFGALVQKLRSSQGQQTVRFPARGGTLVLSGRQIYDLPNNVRWDFGKTVVRVTGAPGGNSMLMRFGTDTQVLGLSLELTPDATWDRLLSFDDRSFVDRLQVSAEQQLANGDDNADGLVQVRGSDVELRAASLTGIDRPLIVIGGGATAQNSAELKNVQLVDLRVRRFLTGVRLRNVRDCRIVGYHASERSRNANQNPGHNGLLIGHVQNLLVDRFRIDDAGEHAIRIGGSPNKHEIQSKNVRIQDGVIRQPGKCAIKFWSGGKDLELPRWFTSDVEIRRIEAVDCGFGGKLSVNENAVHLEAVQDFVVDGLTARADRSSASCHDVLFLAGCSRGRIENVSAQAAARSVVWITQNVANTRDLPVRALQGRNIRSKGHRGDFIHLDIPSEEAGPFEFSSLESDGGVDFVGGVAGRMSADGRFEGVVRGLQGQVNALGGNRRVKVNAART